MKTRMTEQDLRNAIAGSRLKDKSIEIAIDVLCAGLSHAETAQKHGVERQRVSKIVSDVQSKATAAGANFLCSCTLALPEDVCSAMKKLESVLATTNSDNQKLISARITRFVNDSIKLAE